MSSRKHKKKNKIFDKYEYYRRSVQSPDTDTEFFEKVYLELNQGKKPKILREDFCGTFLLSCEWVKRSKSYRAIGLDLDPEPLNYGKEKNLQKLTADQKKRIELYEKNVLDAKAISADILAAMNFSYFIFKTRSQMKEYFAGAYQALKKDGIFLLDIFGGSLCYDQNIDRTKYKGFTYFWEQDGFDPITHKAKFHIHFKIDGQKRFENVFNYDWRLWSIAEIRELLEEVGFSQTHVYWEGTNSRGGGNDIFTRTEKGEECQSWIAYIAGQK